MCACVWCRVCVCVCHEAQLGRGRRACHVERRAAQGAGHRLRLHEPREPKVGDLELPPGAVVAVVAAEPTGLGRHQQVLRLQVPMYNVPAVQILEARCCGGQTKSRVHSSARWTDRKRERETGPRAQIGTRTELAEKGASGVFAQPLVLLQVVREIATHAVLQYQINILRFLCVVSCRVVPCRVLRVAVGDVSTCLSGPELSECDRGIVATTTSCGSSGHERERHAPQRPREE